MTDYFYPDNPSRQERVSQLATDAAGYLQQANLAYASFETVIGEINTRIAALYEQAGIEVPPVITVDVAAESAMPIQGTIHVLDIVKPLLDVAGFLVSVRYLGPGLVSFLTSSGILTEEAAVATYVTVWGGEIALGPLIAFAAPAIVVGVVIAAIGVALDLYEGAELRDQLRQAITKLCQVRADLCCSCRRGQRVVTDLQALNLALQGLTANGLLTPQTIQNLIQTTVLPSIAAAQAITIDTVEVELDQLDQSRHSWTDEDSTPVAPPTAAPPPVPLYLVRLVAPRPPQVPPGLLLCPQPGGTGPAPAYPTIQKDDLTVWPFTIADGHQAIRVVAFDRRGVMVNAWTLPGITTVTRIHADPHTNMVCFTGDGGAVVHMLWSQILIPPPPPPLRGAIDDVLEFGPASTDFGLVGLEPVIRPLLLHNTSDQVLTARVQVVSALAADRNRPYPKDPPLPAVVTVGLARQVSVTVDPYAVTEVDMAAALPMDAGWDYYSPSDFRGGAAVEVEGYGGQIITTLVGAMNGGLVKPGVGAHVTVPDSAIPPFAFSS